MNIKSLVDICVAFICTQVVPTLEPPKTLQLPADLATLVLDYMRIEGHLEIWHLNLFKDIGLTHVSLSTPKQGRFTPVTDEWLQLIAHHSTLVFLELSQCYKISNTMVAQLLPGLTNLRHLNLERCRKISDAGLGSLSMLTNLEFLDLSGTQVTSKTVCEQISHLTSLTSLGLSGSGTTDTAVVGLKNLTNLRHLAMGKSTLHNDACHLISEHTQLQSLVLPFSSIGKEVAWFAQLHNLTNLDVSLNAHINDSVLATIAGMDSITALDLSRTEITDAGVGSLTAYHNLTSLKLNCVNIGDLACMVIYERFKKLSHLEAVYCTNITDEGVGKFSVLPELTDLKISFCTEVGDRGMAYLAGCTQLRSLDIGSKRITNAGILSLKTLTNLTALTMWETNADYIGSILSLTHALPLLPPLDERMNTTSGTFLFQQSN